MSDDDKRKKIIDVSKPKHTSPASNIDTSRVSAYTQREQAALEKLKKQVGNLNQKENRASNIKSVVAIILVLLLILLVVVFIIVIGRGNNIEEEDFDMRLSMQIENKDSLSIITEAGLEKLREINPGDTIPLRASVRNSHDMGGELVGEDENPTAIYVRFKLVLILDYEERYDIMVPTITEDDWYKYDQEEEAGLHDGVSADDHYYYYKDKLMFKDATTLFSSILFDGNVITCEDGGKYGQIQVYVECIPAYFSSISNREYWKTAPQGWIEYMRARP